MASLTEIPSKKRKNSTSAEIEADSLFCHIKNLQDETLIQIFQYLTFTDASFACKRWLEIIDSNVIHRNSLLKIDENNCEKILEPLIMSRLISRKKFKNISIGKDVPLDCVNEIIKACGNNIHFLKYFDNYLKLKDLNLLCIHLCNLETLEIRCWKIYEVENILDFNCLKKLRNINSFESIISHFVSFIHPLESITLKLYCAKEANLIELLKQHSSSLKRLEIDTNISEIGEKKWIETLIKMESLEELAFKSEADEQEEFFYALEKVLKMGYLSGLKKLILDSRYTDFCSLIENLSTFCKDMKDLQIMSPADIEDRTVLKISELSQLQILTIYDGTWYPSESIICTLAENLSNLREFNLRNSCGITDNSLQAIYKYLIKLRVLRLDCSQANVTDGGLTGKSGNYSIERLKGLNELDLNLDCRSIREDFFELNLPELRKLIFQNCHLTENCMKLLIKNFTTIENLKFSDCEIDEFESEDKEKLCNELRLLGLKRLKFVSFY